MFLVMSRENNRFVVVKLFESGKSAADIVQLLGMPRRTVYDAINRYKELGTTADRLRRGRPLTVTTRENVEKLRRRIRRNPGKSIRKLARELKMKRESVRLMVRKKLKLRSYKLGMGHYLDDRMKRIRLVNAQRLLKKKSCGPIVFTDEKVFTIERAVNRQNHRQLLRNSIGWIQNFLLFHTNNEFLEKSPVQRRHFPKSVMVWAGICKNGKTPLVFVERGVKINADTYQKCILRDILMPWSRQHFKNGRWTLQQDWAPAHSAKSTMNFCELNKIAVWDKTLWPSNSPDLNPMDFAIWSILEQKACTTNHRTIDSLKRALQKAWDEISENTLAAIVKNFRKRLKACVAADGGHFENLLK